MATLIVLNEVGGIALGYFPIFGPSTAFIQPYSPATAVQPNS